MEINPEKKAIVTFFVFTKTFFNITQNALIRQLLGDFAPGLQQGLCPGTPVGWVHNPRAPGSPPSAQHELPDAPLTTPTRGRLLANRVGVVDSHDERFILRF